MSAGQKKVKINVALDPDVFAFLQTVDNRSAFVNRATRILMAAHQKAGNATTRTKSQKAGASRSEANA